MSTLSIRDALALALKEMHALSPEELRADLDKHEHGALATAMRSAREFLSEWTLSRSYHFVRTKFVLKTANEDYSVAKIQSPVALECGILAINDDSYALAA
jgi:hypothetical protein